MPWDCLHSGAVEQFDAERGIGWVAGAEGGRYFFHCTAIADGTRSIDVGAKVTFEVVPGHLGLWEARALRSTPIL